jgi:hypothetical protein
MTESPPEDPGDVLLERLAKLGDTVLAKEQAAESTEQPPQGSDDQAAQP